MIDKLDFLVRFWELKARNASLGRPLDPHEKIELLSLMQLVTSDLEVPTEGPIDRPRTALPAHMIGDGAICPAEIRWVSAAAVAVSGASPVPVGAHVILHAADAILGIEYALPCSVLWVYKASPTIIALSVDGIPTRTIFADLPEPWMSMPMALGTRSTRPLSI
ncbi:MAG: hypothetical protein FWD73_17550 [Polyangiaceae bacterium]|nr:hypothetical protein [Polyangiaceae bacterium]